MPANEGWPALEGSFSGRAGQRWSFEPGLQPRLRLSSGFGHLQWRGTAWAASSSASAPEQAADAPADMGFADFRALRLAAGLRCRHSWV